MAVAARGGAERSFKAEVRKLQLGADAIFHGDAILALAKALLESGVAYVGGYPGAPVSHLMDVFADAREEVLDPLGVQFESSGSEAGAAALLGASIHYPLRGAVTWKSIVGTNVASDALSNLASAGVTGGALAIIGEDYGEGASVIQERTLATAMKSSLPLLDPRNHLPRLVELTAQSFDLSEASNLPVMLSLRIRAAHMTGSFVTRENRAPAFGRARPLPGARFDYSRVVLPPSTYAQEHDKFERRLPAARRFVVEHGMNERFDGEGGRCGIVMQGGTWNVVLRGLRLLGAADALGSTPLPLLVLNVIHPLVPEQIVDFARDKDHLLVVEEGSPALLEDAIRSIVQREGLAVEVSGKGMLPTAGEYVADVVRAGLAAWLEHVEPRGRGASARARELERLERVERARAELTEPIPPRPPGFCTGCPERPIFTALKLLMRERGPLHISADIGCSTFATLPPFEMGSSVLGYGLSLASGGAVGPALGQPTIAVMGDGGFWHNGIATGAASAHWNGLDAVLVIIENGYASATGQQRVPSSGATSWGDPRKVSIEATLRGLGIEWVRRVDSYDVAATLETLREALDRRGPRLRVVISDQECMLARERHRRAERARRLEVGKPVRIARFGVDESICTGDHACMRLSGCPSLTLRPARDPLKDGPGAQVDEGCVACGLCGSAAQAATLCPSFYRAERTANAGRWRRFRARAGAALLRTLGAS